jgi:hypothetical protein
LSPPVARASSAGKEVVMSTRLALVAAVLALPAAARAQASGAPLIQPPPGATLVGSSTVDEIRALPELARDTSQPLKEKLVGVEGVDRVFTTDRSFGESVAYFDSLFKQGGYRRLSRNQTPSATAWTVKRPDGSIAAAVVRNTTPTTLELTEPSAAQSASATK